MPSGIFRTCCPRCGGKILISELCQYTREYSIKLDGTISNRYKKHDNGSMDCMIASCENEKCDIMWEDGEFFITDNRFEDFKYEDNDDE